MFKSPLTAFGGLLSLVLLAGGVGAFLVTQQGGGRVAIAEDPSEYTEDPLSPAETGPEDTEIPARFDASAPVETNRALLLAVLSDAGAGAGITPTSDVLAALDDKGFPLDKTTYTNPATQIEFPADSISIAVSLEDSCLIGQFSSSWVTASVQPALAQGTCLIGDVLDASSPDS